MRVVLVGLGGIGSHLAEPLARTLQFAKSDLAPRRLILIDGDAYDDRNRERQRVSAYANKAEATSEALRRLIPELEIESKPHFVEKKNVFVLIREGDIVFLAVDNHATRKLVSEHVGKLENALLISGGNELYDGNIQVYERRGGKDLTHPITWRHPEIENPKDRNPAEKSCEELHVEGEPQILAVNFVIASLMLSAFTNWLRNGRSLYREQFFDLVTGNARAVKD